MYIGSYTFSMNSTVSFDWKSILGRNLPERIYSALCAMEADISCRIEEIRLRTNRPLMVYTSEQGLAVSSDGKLGCMQSIVVTKEEMEQTFGAITGKSPYAYENELKQGFLTLPGGIRAGFAGSAVVTDGTIRTYRGIGGINFRIPCHAKGVGKALLPYISRSRGLVSTLIFSAPKLGKTTLARDIARMAGNGDGLNCSKVSLIDERAELAAAEYGEPLFDVGAETDVISGVAKAAGVFMALRALSPDVIVTDEIGRSEDLEALREVSNAGVVMITTAHAPDFNSLLDRLFFRQVLKERMFEAYVQLSASLGRITIEQVYNVNGQARLSEPFKLEAV